MLSAVPASVVFCILVHASVNEAPTVGTPDFVPLGVYLSWERTAACARAQGIEPWTDVERRLDLLQSRNVNLLWVTNMSEVDLPRLAGACEMRGIKLLPCVDSVEAKVEWRWADPNYYDQTLPRVVNSVSGQKSVAGWVLSDEPLEKDFPGLEKLRLQFRALDPDRFTTAVFMWPQAPVAPSHVKLPVFCVDLYPFYGPNDPNGPHTDGASRNFYRGNIRKMLDALAGNGAIGWVMGMCFSDIWGPRRYDGNGHLIGLPGSYLHWRAPTLAEMRWQVWEAFRGGAKGFICYTLVPEAPDPATATAPAPDVTWKEVLAEAESDLGVNALTTPDGRTTPQLDELGRVYAQLSSHMVLIRRWRMLGGGGAQVAAPCQAQAFRDDADGSTYAVVLNDNFHESVTVSVNLEAPFVSATDILRAENIETSMDPGGKGASCSIHLEPGEGTILRLDPASTQHARP